MEGDEVSTSFSSESSPLKKNNNDKSVNDTFDEIEQEFETGAVDDDNIDDSKDYDVDEDLIEDGDDEKDIEENEEVTGDGGRSPASKMQPAGDAFDAFEFARQGVSITASDNINKEQAIPAASDWLDGEKLYTAHVNKNRHFVCVDYPGVIQNQDKALATLGGVEGLSKAITEDLKLELAFRPNDPYCKPTIGSFVNARNLLLKIRRRPKLTKETGSSTENEYEYKIEVIGIVKKVYTFDKMCDFQFLPVIKEADGKYKEILSSIRPKMSDDRKEYLSRQVPIFLPPYAYSRREIPSSYTFDTETLQPGEENDHYIGADRKKRANGTIQISFTHPEVPSEPDPIAYQQIQKLPKHDERLAVLKKLFEERPLWSKAGLMAHLDRMHHSYLKFLLPVVSYYLVNGPWKNLWCRFGYDPRKHPEAKFYQTLDYRVRTMANRQKVEAKRGQELFRNSHYGLKQERNTTLIHHTDTAKDPENVAPSHLELAYIFTPDHVPPYRQMRYQVCDVHHEEVQKMAHENDGKETVCTERDGWCITDFTDVCRDIINASVEKLFTK